MNAIKHFQTAGDSHRPETRETSGFTLIELLVILVVIAVLFMLMLPALAASRPGNEAVECMNNLRQMMTAIHA